MNLQKASKRTLKSEKMRSKNAEGMSLTLISMYLQIFLLILLMISFSMG